MAVVLVPVFVVGASAQGLEVYLPLDGDTTDHSGNYRDGTLEVGLFGTSAWTAAGNKQLRRALTHVVSFQRCAAPDSIASSAEFPKKT
ncbi:MAG: hypothetical protein NTW96_02290 [Planctomycetia bacterium]|nr:hypothetical protein [Planctomycetia bacterium]